jgi:hypothetical protein
MLNKEGLCKFVQNLTHWKVFTKIEWVIILNDQGINDNVPLAQNQIETASQGKIIGGALAAALVGAVVWALIAFYGEFELGILAMGVGALVGITIAYLAKRNVEQSHQIISVIFGLAGVIAGKYFTYYLMVQDFEQEMGINISVTGFKFNDMFEAIDILWIALAAYAAWTFPKRFSN